MITREKLGEILHALTSAYHSDRRCLAHVDVRAIINTTDDDGNDVVRVIDIAWSSDDSAPGINAWLPEGDEIKPGRHRSSLRTDKKQETP